ncbi:MAG: class I adenylate-forming enzyme family protein [Candidatus Hodarchaeales archaeon]|jgi:acyl-CoA synthetase (AMP-forming)/AMP-acid ligase II
MLVNEFLENSAQNFPSQQAIYFNNNWLTYSEIEMKANKLANCLKDQGVKQGDRIALLSENSFTNVIVYYGILKCGGITVELNTEITMEDIKYLVNDCQAKGIILQKKYLNSVQKMDSEIPSINFIICDDIDNNKQDDSKSIPTMETIFQEYDAHFEKPRVIDVDIASIIYTSGSTGKPKGVVLTHLNIISNTKSIVEYLKLQSSDRIMVILPFFYVYGKSLLNTHIFAGGSIVIDNRFTFPNAVLKTMAETKCTGIAGVPSTFSILLNKSVIQKMKFPHLRYVTQAGGAMAPSIQKMVASVFRPAKLYIMYGATEASARLSYLDPEILSKKWGSIGKAIPNVDLFVADEAGNPLHNGEVGEIVARGSNIMQGYWNDEEETRAVLRNGSYFTGDLGKTDEDGFLFVVGRKKDMIKVGANRISPKSIEEKLLENPHVHEIAVIGVEDEVLGEAIKAFIVCNNSVNQISVEQIFDYCKKELPPFKVPKYIEFVGSLPKNSSGKVLKQKLKTIHSV